MISTAKQSLTKRSFKNRKIFANHLCVLMRVNCTPTQYVNLFHQDITRVGILIKRPTKLHRDRTRPIALRITSCPASNAGDLILKLKSSIQQVDRKKLTASVLMVLCFNATLSLKLWDDFFIFVSVIKLVPLSEDNIQRSNIEGKLDELRRNYIEGISFTLFGMWECDW